MLLEFGPIFSPMATRQGGGHGRISCPPLIPQRLCCFRLFFFLTASFPPVECSGREKLGVVSTSGAVSPTDAPFGFVGRTDREVSSPPGFGDPM